MAAWRGSSPEARAETRGPRGSIRARLTAGSAALLCAVAVAIIVSIPNEVRRVAERALEERAATAIAIAVTALDPAVAAGDIPAAAPSFEAFRAEPGLVYVVVLDPGDRTFAAYEALAAESARFRNLDHEPLSEDGSVWRVTAPLPRSGGRIHMGFSTAGIDAAAASARTRAFAIAALVFVLGVVAIYGIAAILTDPLRQIGHVVARVSAGDLGARTELRSRDEIGWLARSFDTMIARLDEAYGALQTANRDLEDRVGERTRLLRREIDERNRAESALRESEQRFRTMFDSAAMGIALLGPNGHFIESNRTLGRLLGYAPADITGTPISSLVAVQDRQLWARIEDALTAPTTQAAQAEVRFLTADGQALWGRIVASAMTPAQGAPVLGIVMIDDITERKTLEEQLRQSQKLEAVGRLAGGIAHDFNNLLTTINGLADVLLSEHQEDRDLARDVTEIRKAGDRAAALTAQLLAFSRRQIVLPEVIDLNETIRDMGSMLARLLGPDVALEFDLDPQLHAVRADPGQLAQVVMNLVVNARDAISRGGSVFIETRNIAAPEAPRVRMRVRDTGTGIDPEIQQHIFEPFFTTKEQGKGTGLGLSTVYGIVQQAGGSIEVESVQGEGSTFTVTLPGLGCLPAPARPAQPRAQLTGHETVLLVEDEDAVRELVGRILRKTGYTVLESRNGSHALEIFAAAAGKVDAIVTDVVMPEMTGPELVRRLASVQPGLPVIFMSGYTQDEVLENELDQRGTSFLQKPMSASALTTKLREVLDTRAA